MLTFLLLLCWQSFCLADSLFESIPDGPDLEVFSYLQADDLFCTGLCSKSIDTKVLSYLQGHHKQKELANKLKDFIMIKTLSGSDTCPLITVKDYLSSDRPEPMTKIFGLNALSKDSIDQFIHLILKSAPQGPKLENLDHFYNQTMQMASLTKTKSPYTTPAENLAGLLLELMLWSQLRDQAWEPVALYIRDGYRAEAARLMDLRLGDDIANQIAEQLAPLLYARLGEHRADELMDKVWIQVWSQIWEQGTSNLKAKIKEPIQENLQHFPLALNHTPEHLDEPLGHATDYTLMVYQLGALTIRNSRAFQDIHRDLSHFISELISDESARSILESLNIPDASESFIITSQLKLLRKYAQPYLESNQH